MVLFSAMFILKFNENENKRLQRPRFLWSPFIECFLFIQNLRTKYQNFVLGLKKIRWSKSESQVITKDQGSKEKKEQKKESPKFSFIEL